MLKTTLAGAFAETAHSAIKEVAGEPSQLNLYTEAIQEFFDVRTERIASEVNTDTERQLRAALTEGLTAGETDYEIRARLEEVFGANATLRANRMAQYQVSRVMSYADIQAWEQSGVVDEKEWYTAKDERVCPGCRSMHGRKAALQEVYFKKGETLTVDRGDDKKPYKLDFGYEDIRGCPLHNKCRCVLLPVRRASI